MLEVVGCRVGSALAKGKAAALVVAVVNHGGDCIHPGLMKVITVSVQSWTPYATGRSNAHSHLTTNNFISVFNY